MKVVNYTELRLNLKQWLDVVIDDMEEVIIKRKNQKDLILVSLEEYNALVETNYLLSGKNREILLESISSVKGGNKEYHQLQVE